MPGSVLLSHRKLTLSLALNGFTSEFEMGSGGSHSLSSSGKTGTTRREKVCFEVPVQALNVLIGIVASDRDFSLTALPRSGSPQRLALANKQVKESAIIWSSLTVN